MAGWITLFFDFVLWPIAVIWTYVDVPAKRAHIIRKVILRQTAIMNYFLPF